MINKAPIYFQNEHLYKTYTDKHSDNYSYIFLIVRENIVLLF